MNDTIDDRMYGVVERVTRVETLLESHSKESQEFRQATVARFEKLDAGMHGINGKLDAISTKIATAETNIRAGFSVAGWLGRQVPSLSLGGALVWLATHLWPFR